MYNRLFSPARSLLAPSLVQAQVDRLFRDAFDLSEAPVSRTPGLNIWERDDAVVVEAELPGVTLADIEVTVLGRDVTVSGERKLPEVKDGQWVLRERGAGKFTRSVRLPYDVDSQNAQATLREGVLTLTLPRVQPVGPRKITVA